MRWPPSPARSEGAVCSPPSMAPNSARAAVTMKGAASCALAMPPQESPEVPAATPIAGTNGAPEESVLPQIYADERGLKPGRQEYFDLPFKLSAFIRVNRRQFFLSSSNF